MSDFFVSTLGPRKRVRGGNSLSWSALVGNAPEPSGWSIPEAFIAVLLAAVTCDGEIAASEHEEILALVHRSRGLKSLSPAQLAEINVKTMSRLRDEGGALADACAALPKDMRASVFAHALDLVLADGELTIDEADFLNTLILRLDLDRDEVAKISDVIVLKNRY